LGFEKFGLVSYASQTRVARFVEYLEAGKICGTKCLSCGHLDFPPRAYCSRCFSEKWEWAQLSGKCKLVTFTKVDSAPAAFKAEAPYFLGLAELLEGPKVFASIDASLSETDLKPNVPLLLEPRKLGNGNFSYALMKPATV